MSEPIGLTAVRHRSRGPRRALGLIACAFAVASILAAACSADAPSPTPPPAPGSTPFSRQGIVEARVVDVLDGSTIDVEIDGQVLRVRYLGIESLAPVNAGSGTSLGDRALQFNRFLVHGRTVQLERGGTDVDEAGRLLRYVYVDGEMVNKAMLTNGYATVAASPESFERRTEFAVAEESAKKAKRGYWDPQPEGPAAGAASSSGPASQVEPFSGGTLPLRDAPLECEFTDEPEPVIKGNVDKNTDEKVYHVPGGFFYGTTVVEAENGDRWFCTEEDALAAGWKRSKH